MFFFLTCVSCDSHNFHRKKKITTIYYTTFNVANILISASFPFFFFFKSLRSVPSGCPQTLFFLLSVTMSGLTRERERESASIIATELPESARRRQVFAFPTSHPQECFLRTLTFSCVHSTVHTARKRFLCQRDCVATPPFFFTAGSFLSYPSQLSRRRRGKGGG